MPNNEADIATRLNTLLNELERASAHAGKNRMPLSAEAFHSAATLVERALIDLTRVARILDGLIDPRSASDQIQ